MYHQSITVWPSSAIITTKGVPPTNIPPQIPNFPYDDEEIIIIRRKRRREDRWDDPWPYAPWEGPKYPRDYWPIIPDFPPAPDEPRPLWVNENEPCMIDEFFTNACPCWRHCTQC